VLLIIMDGSGEKRMDVGEEYERRKKLNPSEPAPLPHPDDIIVNPATGKITLCGADDEGGGGVVESN
jgi:hypothetical protein